jgi:hypothetical protein
MIFRLFLLLLLLLEARDVGALVEYYPNPGVLPTEVFAGTNTLNQVVSAIGANTTTLLISTAGPALTANLTVPSNVTLDFTANGSFACGTFTATIQSSTAKWPSRQIFANDCSSTGSVSFSGTGALGVMRPAWWGCKGDNTDCSAAIQAAISAIDTGPKSGTLEFPVGIFPFSNVSIPVTITALTITGMGSASAYQKGTYLENTGTTPLFTTSGSGTLSDLRFKNLQMRQTNNSRGHLLSFINSISRLKIEGLYVRMANPAASFVDALVGNPALINVEDTTAEQAAGASVPLFNIASGTPGANVYGVHFKDSVFYGSETSTAPIIKIDNRCGACTGYSSQFTNVTLETPGGGGIHLYSMQGPILTNVISADLTAAPSQPTIYFAKSTAASSLPSKDMTIINGTFTEGDATNPDVKVESLSAQSPLTIINSRMTFLDTSVFCLPIMIGSVSVPTLASGTVPFWITAGGRMSGVNDIQFTKTNSPQTCSSTTEGAHYYDTSLKLDCFCDGTNWCRVSAPATCTSNSSCG